MLECKAGQPNFKATRRMNDKHQIEEVGAKLRALMPWIAKYKLVDRGRRQPAADCRRKTRPALILAGLLPYARMEA